MFNSRLSRFGLTVGIGATAIVALALAWGVCSLVSCTTAPPTDQTTPPTNTTFNDPQGDYSLSYPVELEKDYQADTLVLRLPESDSGPGAPSLYVTVDPNPDGLSVDQYYDGDPGENLFGNSTGPPESISIPAGTALEFHPKYSLSGATIFIIPAANRFIKFVDDGNTFQENGQIQQVLQGVSI